MVTPPTKNDPTPVRRVRFPRRGRVLTATALVSLLVLAVVWFVIPTPGRALGWNVDGTFRVCVPADGPAAVVLSASEAHVSALASVTLIDLRLEGADNLMIALAKVFPIESLPPIGAVYLDEELTGTPEWATGADIAGARLSAGHRYGFVVGPELIHTANCPARL